MPTSQRQRLWLSGFSLTFIKHVSLQLVSIMISGLYCDSGTASSILTHLSHEVTVCKQVRLTRVLFPMAKIHNCLLKVKWVTGRWCVDPRDEPIQHTDGSSARLTFGLSDMKLRLKVSFELIIKRSRKHQKVKVLTWHNLTERLNKLKEKIKFGNQVWTELLLLYWNRVVAYFHGTQAECQLQVYDWASSHCG